MTIHLPNDLELSLEAVVNSGRFASLDDAMAEAARRLLRELGPMEKGLALANTGRFPRRSSSACSSACR